MSRWREIPEPPVVRTPISAESLIVLKRVLQEDIDTRLGRAWAEILQVEQLKKAIASIENNDGIVPIEPTP